MEKRGDYLQEQQYKPGECFIAYVKYEDKQGGKKRPVVIIHDQEENQYFACKVTSRVQNKLNQKYGYKIKDWKAAGLDKPSIIKCNTQDVYKLQEPIHLFKKIGKLTTRDLEGLLVKHIKVRFFEYRKRKENEYGK